MIHTIFAFWFTNYNAKDYNLLFNSFYFAFIYNELISGWIILLCEEIIRTLEKEERE